MTNPPVFGAGIWHFATYKDRYATEGYGPPVGLLEQIDKAGAVGDLSVVDLNWPFAGFDGTLDDVKAALERNGLRAVAITPEIYNRDYVKGSITNPDPGVRKQALNLLNDAAELAKQLCIDDGRLFAIDVNDNFRGWDDDMVVGSVHLVETFEFFHTLRKNNWDGVWQLDQFPFREDSVAAAQAAIRFLKAVHRALDALDEPALRAAQSAHDALAAQRLVQQVLLASMAAEA
jgi:L-rhamnose isomerase